MPLMEESVPAKHGFECLFPFGVALSAGKFIEEPVDVFSFTVSANQLLINLLFMSFALPVINLAFLEPNIVIDFGVENLDPYSVPIIDFVVTFPVNRFSQDFGKFFLVGCVVLHASLCPCLCEPFGISVEEYDPGVYYAGPGIAEVYAVLSSERNADIEAGFLDSCVESAISIDHDHRLGEILEVVLYTERLMGGLYDADHFLIRLFPEVRMSCKIDINIDPDDMGIDATPLFGGQSDVVHYDLSAVVFSYALSETLQTVKKTFI